MIKSETITKHKIVCDKCGGDIIRGFRIKQQPLTAVVDDFLEQDLRLRRTPLRRPNSQSEECPTCLKCGRHYKIFFDEFNFEITMREME